MSRFVMILAAVFSVFLAGCAGTLKKDADTNSSSLTGATYKSVDMVMTAEALKLQDANPQFNSKELGEIVFKRMDEAGLIKPDGTHRMEIVIERFNVRHMVAAVVFGFLAGTDSIDGYVRLYGPDGKQLHGFKVNASYSLGGLAGSLDSMRMGWMYDKFSEITVAELMGKTVSEIMKNDPQKLAGATRYLSWAQQTQKIALAPAD